MQLLQLQYVSLLTAKSLQEMIYLRVNQKFLT